MKETNLSSSGRMRYFTRPMKLFVQLVLLVFFAGTARAQIQVGLKFKRLQYVAHEPVLATVKITNLSGRDIDFHDQKSQQWFGFQINSGEGRLCAPLRQLVADPTLHVEAGKTVTRKINLTPVFPVHDLGAYHVRATVYFADLDQFFYSPAKVFQVAEARPIWQGTIGVPHGAPSAGEARTYSLLSYRLPDYTALYVRLANNDRSIVYTTYSLGRIVAYHEPQAALDHANQLHVLQCAAPRTWTYSRIDTNGRLLAQSTFAESRTRPHLSRSGDGVVTVRGGRLDLSAPPLRSAASRFPTQLSGPPVED